MSNLTTRVNINTFNTKPAIFAQPDLSVITKPKEEETEFTALYINGDINNKASKPITIAAIHLS